ncbi:hypothetical protein COCSUDRAFT_38864 [Coccomyxa subellipsoidea C-169]|uniref:MYND-type domain-containing protein n=1 Tax=Coccomyxa subellipsoidea (strain C-169) TaxID=574566 RepID=I0Z8Z1_COCSC|nr:hypothetical protein COCSUDRAFT_38864 [Coccomyxa subellipsoidea C-169]EIE27110.1 hypothetical protein COCSUDRAFT_38864 [Coccomyxa subellipsoidea C-169]|eukprot:XP_005651654.1 hypothetical protein COCSUDRAFT_38864 [Coccomyxa subellipsoidea C-169]
MDLHVCGKYGKLETMPDGILASSPALSRNCLVNLFKICLLSDTILPRLREDIKPALGTDMILIQEISSAYRNPGSDDRFYDSRIQGRIGEQAAHVTSPVQLLGSLTIVWGCMHHGTIHGVAAVALTALKALDSRREHWDVELQRLGLSADGVEKVLRMALTVPLSTSNLPTPDQRKVDAMSSNIKRMKAIDLTGTWSCLSAVNYCKKHNQDPEQTLQEILPALEAAVEQKHDLNTCFLLWMYCNLMLRIGSRAERIITVSEFLAQVKKTRRVKARLDSWGEFCCTNTAGWSPVQSAPLATRKTYWPTLGVALRFKEAIKRDPAFADTELPAFTELELIEACATVRCHQCLELRNELLRCMGCGQCLAKLHKVCLLNDTIQPRLHSEIRITVSNQVAERPQHFAAYENPGEDNRYYDLSSCDRIAHQAAQVTGPMQLLAALPFMWAGIQVGSFPAYGTWAQTALTALLVNRDEWEPTLQRLGLSLDNVEMVLRYGLTMALEASEASGNLTPEDRPSFLATSHRNMQRMKEIDSTSAWSCVCAAKEILPALTAGLQQQKHDLKACPLQFMYCYNLLLQGSRGFNRVTVHDFLGHVGMANRIKARLDSWGEFRCPETGGWSPVESIPLAKHDTFWGTLAVAERFKRVLKRWPAFANSRLPEYTAKDLRIERENIRCHLCHELSDIVVWCGGCEQVQYCSEDCRNLHWEDVHSQDCNAAT